MLERPVTSVADLKSRVELLRPKITLPETEDSWEIISKALQSLSDLCLNGACDFPAELISTVRSISRPLTSSMVSERTRLSGVAIDLTSAVAAGLGTLFEPLLSIFMPVLLSLCGRTNKVLITRARLCITNIVETTQLPSILPYFIQSIKDKSTSIRLTAAEGTLSCMNCLNPPDLEKDTRARDIETVIRTTARDAQADIRAVSRKVFEAYKLLLPSRVESFIAPLSPKMKKYLDIKLANVRTEPPISRLTSSLDVRNHLSSSTSAMPSTRGRPESGPSVTHARSASSSALSTERHMATTNPKAPGPAKTMNQQKSTKAADMPPPLYIPVRPTQTSKVVSVSRSTSGVEARPRVVSTTPVLRPGATTAHSKPPVGLAARTNPADSHREGPHRPQVLTTNSAASQQESSSGPRRVPIPDVSLKASETEKRQQVETTRARVNSAAPRLLHSSGKATNSGANALPVVPVREKPKPVPKVVLEDAAQTGASSRSAKSGDVAGKAIKSGGVTQPTLSQLSRVKATAERKPSSVAAAKQLWGRPTSKPNLSSASSQSSFPRSKSKPGPASRNGGKEPTQPNDIPLPPSPTPPTTSTPIGDDDEPSPPSEVPHAPLLAPVTLPIEDSEAAAATGEVALPTSGTEEGIKTLPAEEMRLTGKDDEAADSEAIAQDGDKTVTDGSALESFIDPIPELLTGPTTPCTLLLPDSLSESPTKTPISSLLSSIQRGFLFTPSSPLSPPQSYLARGPGMQDLPIPFPLSVDGSMEAREDRPVQSKKPFMFGIGGEDYGRSALGNVENLNIHN